MKPAAAAATVFLALVSGAHLARLLLQVEVTAAGVAVPIWLSGVASVVTAGLAVLLWRESRRP
jgi:hypothetical protein